MSRWIAVLLVLVVTSAACADRRPEGDAIVVAMLNSPANLDPRVGADEASQKAHQLIFNSLFHIDDSLQIVPELAESLQQPDDVTYVVPLRKGVVFHDGRELTADDVVYTFRSFLDPNFRGRSGAYRLLASVNARDKYTVEFRLKEPFASFPVNLVMRPETPSSATNARRQPIRRPTALASVAAGPFRQRASTAIRSAPKMAPA